MESAAKANVQQEAAGAESVKKPKRKVELQDLLSEKGFSLFVQQFYDSAPLQGTPQQFTEFLLNLTFDFTHGMYESLPSAHVLHRIRAIQGKDKMAAEIQRITKKVYGARGDEETRLEGSLAQFVDGDVSGSSDSSWVADNAAAAPASEPAAALALVTNDEADADADDI